jgi:sarcosine oxidase subunit beta
MYQSIGIKYMRFFQDTNQYHFFDTPQIKDRYDVVIIGGGVHGLSLAHYLGKLGINDVLVLDQGYVGGGASARTTAILRANYYTPEAIPFFRESLKLYETLSSELELNLLFDQIGRLDIGHSESAIYGLQTRADFNRLLNVNSYMVGPTQISELVPSMDLRKNKLYPVMAALYHPPAGVIRHDAVVWGYARSAKNMGAHIVPFTKVIDLIIRQNRVYGIKTSSKEVSAKIVVNATAGWASTIAGMAGINLPIATHPLQVAVTEPIKPFLNTTVSSANLHVYAYQTDRGEVVIGGGVDSYPSYNVRSGLDSIHHLVSSTLKMFPVLRDVRLLRQWSGLCDMTPDYAPILGGIKGIDGLLLTCGWGSWGFKAAPMAGKSIAELIVTGKTPELIKPFELSRFNDGKMLNERASAPAAAVH